jgi:hypothetical protein
MPLVARCKALSRRLPSWQIQSTTRCFSVERDTTMGTSSSKDLAATGLGQPFDTPDSLVRLGMGSNASPLIDRPDLDLAIKCSGPSRVRRCCGHWRASLTRSRGTLPYHSSPPKRSMPHGHTDLQPVLRVRHHTEQWSWNLQRQQGVCSRERRTRLVRV